MAACGSFQEVAIICQNCQAGNGVKGKCLSCNLLMCEQCCIIHQIRELNLSNEHNIVDIGIVGSYQQNLGGNPTFNCYYHTDQPCCGYCSQCETVVCTYCVATTHNTHVINDMDVGLRFSLLKLKSFSSQVEQDIMALFRHMSMLKSLRTQECFKYETERQKIEHHGKWLKDSIDRNIHKLSCDLDMSWKVLNKSISDEENNLVQNGKELEGMNGNIIEVIESTDVGAVFRTLNDISGYTGPTNIKTNFKSLPEFVPGEATQCMVESIHGTLESNEGQRFPAEISLIEIEHYTTTLSTVDNLLCCPDGSVLINSKLTEDSNTGELQHATLFNGSVKIKEKFPLNFENMTLLPSGELLVSIKKNYLKVLSNTTKNLEKSKYSVAPLKTTVALHVTGDNKIIVGASGGLSYRGQTKVVVMDISGKHLMDYHLDNNNKPLWRGTPTKVTSDNDNIYVIDENYGKDRVVVLKWDGTVGGIYTGSKSEHSPFPGITKDSTPVLFQPVGLVVTKSGRIIVCDLCYKIHVLNKEGLCIKYLDSRRDLGINESPRSLSIDSRGMLFIGFTSKDKSKQNAKISILKMHGL